MLRRTELRGGHLRLRSRLLPFSMGQSRGWLRIFGLGLTLGLSKAEPHRRKCRLELPSRAATTVRMIAAWALGFLLLLGTIERSTCLRSFRCRSRPLCSTLESTLKLRTQSRQSDHRQTSMAWSCSGLIWATIDRPAHEPNHQRAELAMPSGCRPCVQRGSSDCDGRAPAVGVPIT